MSNTCYSFKNAAIGTAILAFSTSLCGLAFAQEQVTAPPQQATIDMSKTTPAAPKGAAELLTPQNSVLIMIDHQPQMAFGVQSHDRGVMLNNVVGLAKAAKTFNVPTVLTTVASQTFSGPIWPELQAVFPDQKPLDRTSMNAWDDQRVRDAIKQPGRPKLLIAGLWTEVCVIMPALDALKAGYEVYAVTDASGGTSKEAHDMAVQRMIQAGVVPVTWQQVMLEWQRDWGRQATYQAVNDVVRQHSGAYGMGVNYARTMFGSAGEGGGAQKTGANERSGTAFGQKVNVNDAQPGPTQGQTR
jgi:nicotinamidase-related amidase